MRISVRLAAMRHLLFTFPLLLAVSATSDAGKQDFPVMRFFEGSTGGQGRIKTAFGATRTLSVRSRGRIEPDGTLVLVQDVREAGKPGRTRTWRIRETAPGIFAGTLSDASGPVKGEVRGNRLHLTYRIKGGFDADQWLTLGPLGRSADNRMTVRKFGVVVAKVSETIRKLE